MILITGGTSFNVSDFLKNTNEEICIVLNNTKPKIIRENIVYFKHIKEFKKSKEREKVNIIINFASSYNSSNSFFSHFNSSFYFLYRLFKIINNKNLKIIINIGSYFQDLDSQNYTKYVLVKNFTSYFYIKIQKKVKYINLKLGDTFGANDNRNKIFKYLKENQKNNEIVFSGNELDIFYPLSVTDITKCINYIIRNTNLFISSNISNVRLYGEPLSLLSLAEQYEKDLNLKFIKKFKSSKVKRPLAKDNNTDFAFIVNKDTFKLIKDI
tara:strand:+ start:173 stop:979 length:807 start_codon:yes stop_codon:yes gene_type:complete